MRSKRRLCVAIFVSAALAGWLTPAASAGVIPTDKGPVRGTSTAFVNEYLGIPYAAPPAGDLRWRPPQPVERWHGPRDATHFANHCPQKASPFGSSSVSEDCLYLNVYGPKSITDDKGKSKHGKGHLKNLPVMFWIHGGGFVNGESDDYDPTRLVQKGTVVVTINYRLGALGFLAHPALTAEGGGSSSNYGLMDQQAALRWVRRNIGRFGGDPANVTIFGESAGGFSVLAHVVSPLSTGLFNRAIAQSGAYGLTGPSLSTAETQGTNLAQSVGCSSAADVLACLRATPASTLNQNLQVPTGEITPPVDGRVLPKRLGEAIANGEFNRVPVMEGSTHDEFALFYKTAIEDALFAGKPPDPALYIFIVPLFVDTLQLGKNPGLVLQEYPLSNYENKVGLALTAMGTDAIFACPGRRVAQGASQYVPAFAYEFNDRNAPNLFNLPPTNFPYGAYHATELPYLFDSTTFGGHAPFTPQQEQLSAAMIKYWTQFARSGSPNGAGVPQWPAYTAANDTYQSLEPPAPKPETGFAADHHCAFWDAP
jgi:para-nitrobenzyl esterase